jgi:hypothetical protein
MWEVGLPPLLWSFPPTATFTGFPAPGCWVCAAAPAFSSWIVVRDSPPPLFGAQGPPPSLLHVFLLLLLIIQFFFSFFAGWGSVCPGGYADLARVVCRSTVYHLAHLWSVSSQAIWVLASGDSVGALLISPLNVKWGCSTWAGGVEESKFCLFSVVFPVRCISSVSPRFYFRRLAFCFHLLAAILEFPSSSFLMLQRKPGSVMTGPDPGQWALKKMMSVTSRVAYKAFHTQSSVSNYIDSWVSDK